MKLWTTTTLIGTTLPKMTERKAYAEVIHAVNSQGNTCI